MIIKEAINCPGGNGVITFTLFDDGSAWTALGKYGDNGYICSEYINGKLRFNIVNNRFGTPTVRNKLIISEFKKTVKEKFKELSKEWHIKHNDLYDLV